MASTTRANTATESGGLSGRFGSLVIDGLGHVSARHPDIGGGALDGAAFPLSAFGVAELGTSVADVEWPGIGGAFVSAHSLRGSSHLAASAYGDWAGGAARGGVMVSGPILRDTAAFAVGVEARHLEATLPAPWGRDSLAGVVAAVASDSSGVTLDDYFRPYQPQGDIISAFGRFDWQIAAAHALSLRASLADISLTDPDLGPGFSADLGSSLAATEISAGAALTSRLSPRLAQEVRFGVDASTRDYRPALLTEMTLVDAGITLGAPSALPGRLKRTTIHAGETLHLDRRAHRIKLGSALQISSHDQTYASGRQGAFVFAGDSEFTERRGVFTQAVGSLPVAVFQTTTVTFFAQDHWTPAPGLDVTFGVRYEQQRLPQGVPRRNAALLAETGIDNTDLGARRRGLRPRFGFRWAGGPSEQWVVQGSAGIFDDEIDPAAIAEVVSHAGAVETRRAVGLLGSWPGGPDSTVAPVAGAELTVINPELAAPRTTRIDLIITKALGSRSALNVAGAYRHTDFLVRRRDLNLPPSPSATDQYGRPLNGVLVQQGSLLASAPRSNRRFTDFDRLSVLNPDGYSDYYGATIALERPAAGRFGFLATYTFSRTTDNWLGARGGGPDAQLSPFPDSVAGVDWSKGRSDFDVPHRLVVGLEWRVMLRIGLRLAALYRYHSGAPYTPGFRDGVDANGDGSARNDPAFVTDTVQGAADLIAGTACLRAQIGRFADRNSCRGPGVTNLDLRLGMALATIGSAHTELVLDALNLIQSDAGLVDHALYLVDRARTIATDPVTGVVTVPLVANPNFGRLLVRRAPDRVFRIGLRVTY